jgi:hypothetical protein
MQSVRPSPILSCLDPYLNCNNIVGGPSKALMVHLAYPNRVFYEQFCLLDIYTSYDDVT